MSASANKRRVLNYIVHKEQCSFTDAQIYIDHSSWQTLNKLLGEMVNVGALTLPQCWELQKKYKGRSA